MNLAETRMEPAIARVKYLEYRRAVRERHQQEDVLLMRGYRAIAQGKSVIALSQTIRAGGYDGMGLPKLAVIRADAKECHVLSHAGGRCRFANNRWPAARSRYTVNVSLAGFRPAEGTGWERTGQAILPSIPPSRRPADDLGNYHLLWEAEWKRQLPKDPALLKHISGEFYAVLSVWDLSELEQLVLGMGLKGGGD